MAKNTYLCGQPILCQLLSFLPKELVEESVSAHQSDRYYKTMTTYKQLVFLFYGVVMKCKSLNNLCKNLLLLEDKLTYLGIKQLPAVSTLSDANINRNSDVFATIYRKLYTHYQDQLKPTLCHFTDALDIGKVFCFDSSTITLFVDIFKGAGRNTLNGKKKGGLKVHTKMPLMGFVPDMVTLSEAASNDKTFLGQLPSYEVLIGQPNHLSEYADGGIISDQQILLKDGLEARLVIFKDHESGKVLHFVSNMFDYEAMTIVQLYKYRWNIEVLFKQLKQNFELCYFFSDSSEGIKTQIWIALIAQLIFSVIHRQIKEAEAFVTLVNVASNNMASYVGLVKIMKTGRLKTVERNLKIIQLQLFQIGNGGAFENKSKTNLNSS